MKKLLIIFGLISVMLLASCSGGESAKQEKTTKEQAGEEKSSEEGASDEVEIKLLSGEEAKELVNNKEAILVDVRTKEEYDDAHIEGAKLLPLDQIMSLIEKEIPDKDTGIIVYCRSGRRSNIAANALKELGYTNLYDMGPMDAWK